MEETLTAADIARMLGISRDTVRVYRSRFPNRLPPFFKTPGSARPLWDRAVVAAWLLDNASKYGATLAQYHAAESKARSK